MYNENENSINFVVLKDREVKQIPVSLAKVITRDIKPLVFLNGKLSITSLSNGSQFFFVITDSHNALAFILRDDKGDFGLTLKITKAKLDYEFKTVCGVKRKYRFVYDDESFYLLDVKLIDENKNIIDSVMKGSLQIQKAIITFTIRDNHYYLPIRRLHIFKEGKRIGVGIAVYYKDYSRLFHDIVSSVYTLKDK